mgnify:CR=1 FL=1
MAQIIDFPNIKEEEEAKQKKQQENEYKADRTAKVLLYLGLSVSIAVLTVGSVLNVTRQAVKKVRKKISS